MATYLATYMLSASFNERIRGYYERASIPKINRTQLFETEVPLPPLAMQEAIVAEIVSEQILLVPTENLLLVSKERFRRRFPRVGRRRPTAPEV